MVQNVAEVFRVTVPSLGMVLKARADIVGKQEAYRKRINDGDAKRDESAFLTEYSANVDCTFNFTGGDFREDMPFTSGGEAIKALPVFFETRYFFRGDFKPADGRKVKDVQVEHRMASIADAFNYDDGTLVGTLDFINEPGRFRLDLRVLFDDGTERSVWLEFWVVSVKMNVTRDYREIIKTIDDEKPNIVRAFLSKTFWGAALDRDGIPDDKSWYEILMDVFDYYESACRRIVHNPHQRYDEAVEWRRADRVKRWSPQLANRFNRMGEDKRTHELFRTERLVAESDTPENRFVLHTLQELHRRLEDFGDSLKDDKQVSQPWKNGISERAKRLEKLTRHPFFRGVSRFKGFRQQSLVLQKSAGYAQILTAWLKLKSALRPGGDDIDVGYRPISTLYEFWCFLKVRDMVAAADSPFCCENPIPKLGSVENWNDVLDDESRSPDSGRLGKIEYEFAEANGGSRRLTLTYQQSYGKESNGEFAYLHAQRPDIVLTIKDDGEGEYSYIFDAKYRIQPTDGEAPDETTVEAIDAMHQYRDAILYRRQESDKRLSRAVIGAYVLYPGRPKPNSFDYSDVIEAENIGAIPLLPGEEGSSALKTFIGKILRKKDAISHLHAVIPTRGTAVIVASNPEEYVKNEVVYGTYRRWQWGWITKNKLYNLPVDKAAEIGIYDKHSANSRSILFLVSGQQGHKEKPSVFRIKRGSAKLITRKELVESHGYKPENYGGKSEEKPEDNGKKYWLWQLDMN